MPSETYAHTFGDVLLNVRNLDFNRNDTPILRSVNLKVRDVKRPGMKQGQVGALLGPSGVGKTSLFRLLAGLETPSAGSITLENDVPVHRGMVGVVSQNYQLFDHRTVLSNLVVAAHMGGYNAKDAAALGDRYLEKFSLQEHADKYPCQLSGGQRQRTAIAQQLLCSDHLLLMDEPFSGLDLLALRKVITLIKRIAETDDLKTFIIVTHDVHAALAVADTIWLLGRDHAEDGHIYPGARIQETYDLMERGLAWHDESLANTDAYRDLVHEIEKRFTTL